MNAPGELNQIDKLWDLVRNDPRTEGKGVGLRPGLYIIAIGGQDPFWQHSIDRERLKSDDIRAYAKEIVDKWAAEMDTT